MTADGMMDHRGPSKFAFVGALALHAAVIGGMLATAWLGPHHDAFGSADAGGVAIGVEAVNSIPLVHHGQTNPLTNDTESEVPQQAVVKPKEQVKVETPPPDAIPLKIRKAKQTPPQEASTRQKFRPIEELQPNQLTSPTAPQLSSPLFSPAPGSGNVGAGKNTVLGTQCGAYADQIQRIVAGNWRTGDVDGRIRTAPKVTADFDLMRDGSIRGLQLTDRSGISPLDSSVQRAIEDSRFPPLPSCFPGRDHASVEFSFELKR